MEVEGFGGADTLLSLNGRWGFLGSERREPGGRFHSFKVSHQVKTRRYRRLEDTHRMEGKTKGGAVVALDALDRCERDRGLRGRLDGHVPPLVPYGSLLSFRTARESPFVLLNCGASGETVGLRPVRGFEPNIVNCLIQGICPPETGF